jgi:hypothetical protein
MISEDFNENDSFKPVSVLSSLKFRLCHHWPVGASGNSLMNRWCLGRNGS